MSRRTLPLLQISTAAGSDPDVIEPIDAPDPMQVYDDFDTDEFGNVIEPCCNSPNGQCQYSWRDKWTRCIHCGRPSELP